MGNKLINNFLWRFFERIGAQLISFLVTIILARLLSPNEFGVVAIITVITSILQVFVDGGFGNALIQKRNADDVDFSTVFYFNIVFCTVVYIALYFASPLISRFYSNEAMTAMIRVSGVIVIISGIKNVQQAYVSRNFMFKKFFYATLGGTLFSAFVGIILALLGFGAWALIFQIVTNTLIDTIILWRVVPWRPKRVFSFASLKIMFHYGYKLLLTSLLNTIYSNYRQLVIGKYYSSADLAYYNRGKQFPFLVVTNINSSLDSVLFSAMSKVQNEDAKINNLVKESMGVGIFFMWPMLLIMAATADSLVRFILTDIWINAVPYLRIFCFVSLTFPIQTANFNALKAKGRSDVCLLIQILETVIGMTLLFLVINKSVYLVSIMYLVTSMISTIIIMMFSWKICNFNLKEQMSYILKMMIIGICVYLAIRYISLYNCLITLLFQGIVGLILYILLSYLFRIEYLNKIIRIIKNRKGYVNE